VEVEAK